MSWLRGDRETHAKRLRRNRTRAMGVVRHLVSAATWARASRLWAEGVPGAEIATRCGINLWTLRRHACTHRDAFPARYGYESRPIPPEKAGRPRKHRVHERTRPKVEIQPTLDPIGTDDFREFQDGGLDEIREGIAKRGKRVRAAPSAPEPEPTLRWTERDHQPMRDPEMFTPPAPAVPSEAATDLRTLAEWCEGIVARPDESRWVSGARIIPGPHVAPLFGAIARELRAVLARLGRATPQ